MAALADKFATNLKSERLRRKLSQEALAAKAGLSVSYISMLERGQRTPPLDTLDRVNRAGLTRAIPAIAQLVSDGDLERLVQLARIYGSMQDAMTEEMVGRLSETVGAGITLLDRFNRGGELM